MFKETEGIIVKLHKRQSKLFKKQYAFFIFIVQKPRTYVFFLE